MFLHTDPAEATLPTKGVKITSHKLAPLPRGYSLAVVPGGAPGDLPGLLAGSEGDNELLYFMPPEFKPRAIARTPGGFISICALARDGRRHVVAATMFKPGFDGADAEIRLFPLDEGECPPSTKVASLPFTHRITMLRHLGSDFLLASTLCSGKSHKDDWTKPGGIHLAEVPPDPRQPWPLRQIVPGLSKNHGMDFAELSRTRRPGWLLSAMEGLFFLPRPADPRGPWAAESIERTETSDAFAFDWDGDGEPEGFSISPFHGHVLALHKKTPRGWHRSVIHEDLAMGHIVWAGPFLGRPGLLAGSRRERRELRLYRPAADGSVDRAYEIIDEGIGPSQMAVVPRGDRAVVLYVAAHGVNEVRRYDIEA